RGNYDIQDNTGTSPKVTGFKIYRIAKAGIGGCHNTIMNNKCNGIPACINEFTGKKWVVLVAGSYTKLVQIQ
ncbi:unnamed protein product, partial [Medioppia subpectinata]